LAGREAVASQAQGSELSQESDPGISRPLQQPTIKRILAIPSAKHRLVSPMASGTQVMVVARPEVTVAAGIEDGAVLMTIRAEVLEMNDVSLHRSDARFTALPPPSV
jgi:hypothetical protein